MSSLNSTEVKRWKKDRGDHTFNVDYNLNHNSIVIDIGGYTGTWADIIFQKYQCNVYIVEPVPQFYSVLENKFKNNSKIHLINVGIGNKNKKDIIFVNNDASSANSNTGDPIEVQFITIDKLFEQWHLSFVDLIQINIEGAEYSLLENMIAKNFLSKFKNIQIQFHMTVDNYETRRNIIRQELINNGFELKFDYPFVWEGWHKNDNRS